MWVIESFTGRILDVHSIMTLYDSVSTKLGEGQRVQIQMEEIRHEPVVAQPVCTQVAFEFLVPVLALATTRLIVVSRFRKLPYPRPVAHHLSPVYISAWASALSDTVRGYAHESA
jgi:hypothetical protein